MGTLTSADWQRLNEFLKSLYTPSRLEIFPAQLLAALAKVIGLELSGMCTFSRGAKTLPRFVTFPDPAVAVATEAFTASPQNFFAHPVLRHYEQTNDGQALAISDLLIEPEFHQEPLYIDFFKYYGQEDQILTFFELLPAPQSLQTTDPFFRGQERSGIFVSRDRRNFTERDRLIINLIRPHLRQAYGTLVAFHQVHHHLTQQQSATDQTALIALSTNGSVQWMTRQAGEILHRYFPPSKAHIALPDLLQQWVNRQLSMFAQLEEVCKLARPLRLQLEGRRLTIRFSYCPKAEQLYLLLEETESEQFSVEALQLLGLTKRESEVLFWVAKDKNMVEVAKLLGMSDRTAKKHLEHIYEKFGVQTRLSAVMYALEHLGIFA
jgi:DNA-binding CsgD family transcriptional regulator